MPAIWLIQSAFRLVGWHFLADEDGKMAETISIVPLSLSFPEASLAPVPPTSPLPVPHPDIFNELTVTAAVTWLISANYL